MIRDRHRTYLSPIDTIGRPLTCHTCQALVDVIEIPEPWIDADRYVCGPCLPIAREPQPPRLRPVDYDPKTSPWPDGY